MRSRLAAPLVLAVAAAACASPTRARRRPPAELPPAAHATGPSAGYREAMRLYAKLDLAAVESRLEAGGLTTGETALVQARLALARLDFERAYTLLEGRTDNEAAPLLWRAAWFSDRLDVVATLAKADHAFSWLGRSVAKVLPEPGRAPKQRRVGVEAVGARRVSVTGDQSFSFPCRVGGKDVRAVLDLSRAISLMPEDLLPSSGWATVTFAADGHELRVTAPFESSPGYSNMILGADLARELHLDLDLDLHKANPTLTLDLDEPAAAPGAQTLALAWPLGERPVVAATIWTDRATPAILGFSTWKYRDLELRSHWAQWHGITPSTKGSVTGVTIGTFAFKTQTVDLATDSYQLDPGDVDLAGLVALDAMRASVREFTLAAGGRELRLR